jgi:hypothetical protein
MNCPHFSPVEHMNSWRFPKEIGKRKTINIPHASELHSESTILVSFISGLAERAVIFLLLMQEKDTQLMLYGSK